MNFTVDVPYTVYSVPVEIRRRIQRVNITGNQLARGAFRSPWRHRLAAMAKKQCRSDFWLATKEATQRTKHALIKELPSELVVRVSATVYRPVLRGRDEDNFWAGMKIALDAVASALEVDDKSFRLGDVTWEKGEDRTVLELEIQ